MTDRFTANPLTSERHGHTLKAMAISRGHPVGQRERTRWRNGFNFSCLIICLFFTGGAVALAERCAVCGEEIKGDTVYLFDDKVTNDKKHVCYDCSILPDACFACGMPVAKDRVSLPDGRFLCIRDSKNAVLDAEQAKSICAEVKDGLDRLFSRFIVFPDNTSVSVVDRVNLLALYKIPGNDYKCPDITGYFQARTNQGAIKYEISVMSALTRSELEEVCAHEYSHAWVFGNVSAKRKETLGRDAEEGFCELVGYLLMDSRHDEREKQEILQNAYTRGQIDLFIRAEKEHGFNDIAEWMKYGVESELDPQHPDGVLDVHLPPRSTQNSSTKIQDRAEKIISPSVGKSNPAPDKLVLKGISRTNTGFLALINDNSFEPGESGKVRVGGTNVMIRCLAISDNSVRIQIVGSSTEEELFLRSESR